MNNLLDAFAYWILLQIAQVRKRLKAYARELEARIRID